MNCYIPTIDILLLGKASRSIDKQDNTHQDLVDKLKDSSLSTNYISWGETTLDYISNPSLAKDYKLVFFDTVSSLYTFDDEGSQRAQFFETKIVAPLIAMNKPIIVLSDQYVRNQIREINEKNDFTHINQPYDIDHVINTVKNLIK